MSEGRFDELVAGYTSAMDFYGVVPRIQNTLKLVGNFVCEITTEEANQWNERCLDENSTECFYLNVFKEAKLQIAHHELEKGQVEEHPSERLKNLKYWVEVRDAAEKKLYWLGKKWYTELRARGALSRISDHQQRTYDDKRKDKEVTEKIQKVADQEEE